MRSQVNLLRARAVALSRVYKDLFKARLAAALPLAWLYRWLFVEREGGVNGVGELVLADLRDFCHANEPTIFDTDPLIMARREGRREVFVRIQNFLNLDEHKVQQLMELDDGE
ncbi:hypothetical protein [Novosphingobium decolorationis]|uniref:Bbp19-like phage domain-containing protein n=1 Tax=Novosphingobium decolorationis TaxID=2698673 RepID=A0ABX8E4F6_9SPHN|nr:hypothetical protein [Novosphingobium decolorationis]QVM82941.1 hypothetical protein HT578_03770 [Novosphingobium decolorationis]